MPLLRSAGLKLLAKNRDDALARRLVSVAVIAHHYETTAVTMNRAFERRNELQEDFDRMINLGLRSAGMRCLHWRANQLELEAECIYWAEQQMKLSQEFCEQRLSADIPSLLEIDNAGLQELEKLHDKRFQNDVGGFQRVREKQQAAGAHDTLYPAIIAIDTSMVMAALKWLDVGAAHSYEERCKWLDLVLNQA